MNKLMGFYELKDSSLPTIPWKIYTPEVELDNKFSWTIRTAINRGDDLNLPRSVGKSAKESKEFADLLYKKISDKGIVIYYPYFIAHKSGTLNVFLNKTVIEAVEKDLWNLVTEQNIDVSLSFDENNELQSSLINNDILEKNEIEELLKNARKVKNMYRDELLEGRSILLEWSYASDCDAEHKIVNKPYLVFYEVRTV